MLATRSTKLAKRARATKSSGNRSIVAAAAVAITLISLAAALLPALETEQGAAVVGSMMILAGCVEAMAATYRPGRRAWSVAPAAITLAAGALVFIDPFGEFLTLVRLVIGWLVGRGLLLLAASVAGRGSVRLWTLLAAMTDLSLAGVLAAGLSSYTFPIALFGVTPAILSDFAIVFAISFIATAVLLFGVAAFEFERTE